MKYLKHICLLFIVLLSSIHSHANQPSDQELIAAYIYNLSKNIIWENEKDLKSFNILFVGKEDQSNSNIKELLLDRSIKEIPVKIDFTTKVTDINKYQLIYLPNSFNKKHDELFKAIQTKNILLITEDAEIKSQILVNLVHDRNGNISFEINKENIKENRLEILPEILLLVGSKDDIRIMFDELKEKIKQEEEKVSAKESLIQIRDHQILAQNALIKIRQEHIDSLRSQIQITLDSLSLVEEEIMKSQDLIDQKQKTVNDQEEKITNQNQELERRELELTNFITEIRNSQNNLNDLTEQIKAKEDEIRSKNISIQEQERLINSKQRYNQWLALLLSLLVVLISLLIRAYLNSRNFSKRLEVKVTQRTLELNESNLMLKREIDVRKQKESELVISKNRVLQLFENSPIAILEQDLSGLRKKLAKYSFKDKIELRNFIDSNPKIIEEWSNDFLIIDSNKEAVNFFNADSPLTLKNEYNLKYKPVTSEGFIEEIYHIHKGYKELEQETTLMDFNNEKKDVILKWVLLPGYDDFSRVLVSIKDITVIKEAEKQLKNYQHDLENLVRQRTSKVREINEELQSTNEALLKQKQELEEAMLTLRETQIQLIQSEKMASVGILTAGIAHEINNPINFINSGLIGFKKSLSNVLESVEKLRSACKISDDLNVIETLNKIETQDEINFNLSALDKMTNSIQVGTDRTVEIVKSLRTFARSADDVLCPSDIHEGIDSTLIMLYHQYKNHITIKKNYNEIPKVTCMPGKINQVFMNIISNAIQAIEKKGVITVSTSYLAFDNTVEISIKDNGKGISAKNKDKIFDPFFSTKPVGKGTGLGLYISYSIIQEHFGTINVKSEENQGTEFIIRLPVNNE